jgi:hypothetical protein
MHIMFSPIRKSTYTSKVYSNFIFNYIKNIERQNNETIKQENSKPGGSQGLMFIQETQEQTWVMEGEL